MNKLTNQYITHISSIQDYSFRKGEIVFGKLTYLENGKTILQMGNKKYQVILPNDLKRLSEGYFKVENASEPFYLSVVSSDNFEKLQKNVNNTRYRNQFPSANMQTISELISKSKKFTIKKPDLSILSYLVKEGYPLSESIYKPLNRIWDGQFKTTLLINQLEDELKLTNNQSTDVKKMAELIDVIKNDANITIVKNLLLQLKHPNEKDMFVKLLKQLDQGDEITLFNSRKTEKTVLELLKKLVTGESVVDYKLTTETTDYLSQLLQQQKMNWSAKQTVHMLQRLTEKLGIFGEMDVHKTELQPALQLKSMLRQYVEENKSNHSRNQTFQLLLDVLDGQQLLASTSEKIISLFYQLPIQMFDWNTNLTMHWESKKNEKGQIDDSFCTVVFHLHMQHLGESVVRLNVQNKNLSLKIYTEHTSLKYLVQPLVAFTKNNLKEVGYHLSAVEFLSIDEHTEIVHQYIRPQHLQRKKGGVDRFI